MMDLMAAILPALALTLHCVSTLPTLAPALTATLQSDSLSAECNALLKPVEEFDSTIYGKWFYIIGASDTSGFHDALGTMKGSWIELTPTDDNTVVKIQWADKLQDGRCVRGSSNVTILETTKANQRINFSTYNARHSGDYLQTFPDCLLWTDTTTNGHLSGRQLLMFRRTAKLEASHVLTFRKQLSCLNFPNTYHSYDGVTALCPESRERTACEDLIKPLTLQDHSQIYGRWYFIVGAADNSLFHAYLTPIKSGWVDIAPTNMSDVLTVRWGDLIEGECKYGSAPATVSGPPTNVDIRFAVETAQITGQHLQSCVDCLLWTDTTENNGYTGKHMYMYRRTPKFVDSHLKMFQRHSECLNFPQTYHAYDADIDMCPDDPTICVDFRASLNLQDPSVIYGKWFYIVGVADSKAFQTLLSTVKSSWMELSPLAGSTELQLHSGNLIDGECQRESATVKITDQASFELSSNTLLPGHAGQYLSSCPDCLLWMGTGMLKGVSHRYLIMFRRTAKLEASHLEIFRRHAACFSFPQAYNSYDGVAELCTGEQPADHQLAP